LDSSYAGFSFWGSNIANISFNNVTFDTAPYAMETNSVAGNAYFTNTVAKNLAKGGIYTCETQFVFHDVSGNSGWNDTHCD